MWQLLTIVVLLGIMVGLLSFDPGVVAEGAFHPKSLVATGFILLAAFTTGELFKRFKIPSLLGYIAAGIIFGPNLAKLILGQDASALFGARVISDLNLISVLTVGVIGTMGGGELKISDIKESWKTILMVVGLIVITAIPLTMATVVGLTYLPFDVIGFLTDKALASVAEEQKMAHIVSAALLFAILAVAMSPAATLAILQETRAKGKYTSLVLGVVVVADLVLVALFLVGFALVKLLISPEGFSSEGLLAALPVIGAEFGWALVIGAIAGVLIILYMRFINREMLFFTVAMIFAASYAAVALHAEALLAFLTAGFIVQNFSKHGHDLIHTLEQISLPVFIIYFMTQAAQLDLAPMVGYLPLTLVLAVVRAGAFWGSAKLTARALKTGEIVERNLWMSFLSRGGVDLVLAAMVANAIKPWGVEFQTVVMSTVVVHIVAGPPLLKFALTRAGETEDTRQARSDDAQTLSTLGAQETTLGEFPEVRAENPYLREHLEGLRTQLISLHEREIKSPMAHRKKRLDDELSNVHDEITQGLEALGVLLHDYNEDEPSDDIQRDITQLHTQTRRNLQPWIKRWEQMTPVAFDARSAQKVVDEIRTMEDFENHYVVEMEPHLYDQQGASTRLGRALRRLRHLSRSVKGVGRRTIPTGRLWRYYVELSVPRYFASRSERISRNHEHFWYELEHTIRRFDETFFLVEKLLLNEPIEFDHRDEEHEEGHDHDDHAEDVVEVLDDHVVDEPLEMLQELMESSDSPVALTRGLVQRYTAHHRTMHARLSEMIDNSLHEASDGYEWSLRKSFEAFLDAVSLAGTLELTGYQYRPSKLYDSANRAQDALRQRLKREEDLVSAYIGWIVVDHQLTLFIYWFEQYQTRITDTLDMFFDKQSTHHLERLLELCSPEGYASEEEDGQMHNWMTWKEKTIEPIIKALRSTLDRASVAYGKGVTSRRLIDALEYRVARLPEEVNLLVEDPVEIDIRSIDELETMKLRVRQWFSHKLVNQIALQYIEFNERVEHIIRRMQVGVTDLEQMLNYNLTTAQREFEESQSREKSEEIAHGALTRAAHAIEAIEQTSAKDIQAVEEWIIEQTATMVDQTMAPFMEHELVDVQKVLQRQTPVDDEVSASLRDRTVRAVQRVKQGAYSSVAPVYEEFLQDVRQIMHEEQRPEQKENMRAFFGVGQQSIFEELPAIYKRLFNPVPLDLPEFYVARPELELRVLDMIDQWGKGAPTSLLLFGDRGVGKRTFIHNLVPIRTYDLSDTLKDVNIQTIRLGDDVTDELQMVSHCWSLLATHQPKTLRALKRRIDALETRQIVLLENATKCYQRTPQGLKLCRAFLDMVSKTSDKILWVFIMERPAAVVLDTMIDLFDYFTHAVEIEAFSEQEIEQMIMKRHRVSGFDVSFNKPQLSILERTRHPLMASEAARYPKRTYFEHLAVQSQGNPLAALLLWLKSVKQDENKENLLHVQPITSTNARAFIDGLSLEKRMILALLLQHNALSLKQLATIMMEPLDVVRTQVEHLQRLGIIEMQGGDKQLVHMRDVAAPRLTRELRTQNLV